ncbi:MAG: hypothetical protein CSB24_06245 [Deltaproteobacteria bacterium]|nr:MAG: hypothetical protein CSB24_06245 [Deltaproteobacteria bacterium]
MIYIIGFSDNFYGDRAKKYLALSSVVFCSPALKKRLTDDSEDLLADKEIRSIIPVERAVAELGSFSEQDVAVLASGDPLFFGIAEKIIQKYGMARVRVAPAVSFMQLLCARFGLAWHDISWLSFHGRELIGLAEAMQKNQKICVFTDHKNTPHAVADYLNNLENNYENTVFYIGQNLGRKEEKLFQGKLQDVLAAPEFASPNLLILSQEQLAENRIIFGLNETEIRHSRGLITKDEIRAAAIHRLKIAENNVVWDVGGGSGSVSIEAARIAPGASFYCTEKKASEQENIAANIRANGLRNMFLIKGEAPEVLASLPEPDRVFIGGSGGRLAEIIDTVCRRIKKGGIVVVNCLLETSKMTALNMLDKNNFSPEYSEIRVSRFTFPENRENRLNPITIITGKKGA